MESPGFSTGINARAKLINDNLKGAVNVKQVEVTTPQGKEQRIVITLADVNYHNPTLSIDKISGNIALVVENSLPIIRDGQINAESFSMDMITIKNLNLRLSPFTGATNEPALVNGVCLNLKGNAFGGEIDIEADLPDFSFKRIHARAHLRHLKTEELGKLSPQFSERLKGVISGTAVVSLSDDTIELKSIRIEAERGAQLNVSGQLTDKVMADINVSIRESIKQGLIQQGLNPEQVDMQAFQIDMQSITLKNFALHFDASNTKCPLQITFDGKSNGTPSIPLVVQTNVNDPEGSFSKDWQFLKKLYDLLQSE